MDTKHLVDKIAALVKKRISAEEVIAIKDLRQAQPTAQLKTLLVIEDDETLRKALGRIFEADGYRVLLAGGASELTNVLDLAPVDLILLDIGLPWINGYELAQMMKEHRDLNKVPLVFISATQDVDAIKRGFSVGAHDFITKPFDIYQVRKTVQTLIELS